MKTIKAREKIQELLESAGINVNGNNPWDLRVFNEKFYQRALIDGSVGIGESYVQEWWDSPRLDELFNRILRFPWENYLKKNWRLSLSILLGRIFNRQGVSSSYKHGQYHYDLNQELFRIMLDKNLVYTCAYWRDAATLDEAQMNKLELTCKKLHLSPGMKLLDIGCGWGGFAKYAAEKYDVELTGITVSEEQVKLARQRCEGLPVRFELLDYRQLTGSYDRIVSLGMFEHVGYKNYRPFMATVNRCLKDDGLFLLHTIGSNTTSTWTDPWINKYIFPGSLLPSIKQIGESIEGLFVMEDWHNFSADYDKTLMAWYTNFNNNWKSISDQFDDSFQRLWNYYLLMCAASFRARKNQLWQIVLSKHGVEGGYYSLR